MDEIVITCDSCGGTRIDNYPKYPPQPRLVLMSTWAKEEESGFQSLPGLLAKRRYVLRCRDCGYTIEYEAL